MTQIELRSDMKVQLIDSMGNDESIARAAMVSTKAAGSVDGNLSPEKIDGLIGFLLKNRHGTPFEHNSMTFFVEAPIFVFREWQRHRINSYNEESARYRAMKPVFWIPKEGRKLVQVGKPGHYTFETGTVQQEITALSSMRHSYETAYRAYEAMLSSGVAREVARSVLPVGTYSSMYVTTNARALMHFLSLRTKDETAKFPSFPQVEIEDAARLLEAEFSTLFPTTYRHFVANGRVAP